MSTQIITAFPCTKRRLPSIDRDFVLNISEFFCDTIQGENFVGWPATFLRLQHCTLDCSFCDADEVWKQGNPYYFSELFVLMEGVDLIRKFREGQRLVLTGGSPMLQQNQFISFLTQFKKKYGFKPYIEVENEGVIDPKWHFIELIDCWNNSPKLANSNISLERRYKPNVLRKLSELSNSWFKFVVSRDTDWYEIQADFLNPELIRKDQIVLMPQGETREELFANREIVLNLAIRENVRYSTREHVVIWDKRIGV